MKQLMLISSSSMMWVFLGFAVCLDKSITTFQYAFILDYGTHSISFGIDGITLLFMFLTASFMPICVLSTWEGKADNNIDYMLCILCIQVLLFPVFTVTQLFFFHVSSEAILIPPFIMVGLRGGRDRKVHASYFPFFYTLVGSLLMPCAIIFVYTQTGTTHYEQLWWIRFDATDENVLWWLFSISFGIKVPIYPFHLWLPEAHVESPTEGSVILAAILLKVSGYGFLRVLLPMFPDATRYFSSVAIALCIVTVMHSLLATFRQIDIKRIVAYSSITHMNIATIGILIHTDSSIMGGIMLMLGHALVSGGMFSIVGMPYERGRTKMIEYYSGLYSCMPVFTTVFFFFTFPNISLPGTCNFSGEFMVLLGSFIRAHATVIGALSLAILLCAFYTLYMYNRISFGALRVQCIILPDLSLREVNVLAPIIFCTCFWGVYPQHWLDYLEASCSHILVKYSW